MFLNAKGDKFASQSRKIKVVKNKIVNWVGVTPIEEKLTQHRLRWFGHVQRRPLEAPVRSGVLKRVDKVKGVEIDLN